MVFFVVVVLFFIFKAGPQSVESLLVLVKYWTRKRNHVVLFDDQEKKSKTLYSTLEENEGLSRRPSGALGNELMSRGSGTF